MGKSQNKAHLSPAERIEIKRLYDTGEYSYRSLGEKFGVSYSTIQRIVKDLNTKKTARGVIEDDSEKTNSRGNDFIVDPIDFRKSKLIEINGDIMSTRMRGSVQVLPALHRLHLQVHDELTQMKKEQDELDEITNPEELLHTIAVAAAGLPPLLKQKLQSLIDNDFTNVIPLKRVEE